MLFVTSTQIKNQPVLGTITRLAGCLFVTRTPWTLQEELNEMSSRAQNIPLAIFPEATSGKGHKLLPFRSASFAIATQQGLHVQPVLLRWNNLTAAWYGDMKFAPHLFTILKTRGLNLHVRFLDPVPTLPGTNRKELCARIEASMHAAFNATQP
jgi:1-acyl-sn-glycerol-3-phosphate acyltransferase